jgi:hypothetical protein
MKRRDHRPSKEIVVKKSVSLLVFALTTSTAALALACPGKGGGKAHMDANSDGKVSLQEALDGAKKRFEHKDADKNGAITKDELGERGAQMFAKHDANNDGKVTLAEMQAKAREWFGKADKNKDGFLTQDERPKHGGRHGSKA